MHKVKTLHIITLLSLVISILTGLRFSYVGKDTEAYINHFYNSSGVDGIYERTEIGFALVMQLFSKSNLDVESFFIFVAFLITIVYTHSFRKIYIKCFRYTKLDSSTLFIYFSLLLLSSWYYSATMNGLRQGISLVIIYWAFAELFYFNKKFKFIVLIFIASTFHLSALIVIPFVIFYTIRFKYALILWVFSACGYVTGLNEFMVKMISNSLNMPVYEYIKYYSLVKGEENLGGGLYEGFILSFFLYTIFWPLVLLFVLKVEFKNKSKKFDSENIFRLLTMYFFLSSIYFILGFGPFSNRYAFFSWFLIPVIQAVTISVSFNSNSFKILSGFILFLSILQFLYIKLDWISYFLY